MITRKQVTVPEFYQAYINAVKEKELVPALTQSLKRLRKFLKEIPKDKRDYAYEQGKWTIRQLLQHMIDSERVFAFRAMWFARRDKSALPGFDEKIWAEFANLNKRKWKDMVNEFVALRQSNIRMFAAFTDEELQATGTANNNVITAGAFGFIAAGHMEHHLMILKKRYLPISLEQAL